MSAEKKHIRKSTRKSTRIHITKDTTNMQKTYKTYKTKTKNTQKAYKTPSKNIQEPYKKHIKNIHKTYTKDTKNIQTYKKDIRKQTRNM